MKAEEFDERFDAGEELAEAHGSREASGIVAVAHQPGAVAGIEQALAHRDGAVDPEPAINMDKLAPAIDGEGPVGTGLVIEIEQALVRGKIAGMMGEFGKGITAFKKGVREGSEEIDRASSEQARDVTPEPKDKV